MMKHILILVAAGGFLALTGCGESACGQYCRAGCQKAADCGFQGITSSQVDACADACTQQAEELFTQNTCQTALDQIDGMSCDDYAQATGLSAAQGNLFVPPLNLLH